MHNRHKKACLKASLHLFSAAALGLCTMALPPAAHAARDAEFEAGLVAFKNNDSKTAVAHFAKSITDGNKEADVYLLSGHCFYRLNELQRAQKTFEIVTTSFKGTPEAKAAADMLKVLKDKMPATASITPGAPGAAGAAATSGAPGATPEATQTLLGRMEIVAPQFNHPKVSRASIEAAQQAIAALPKPLRKRLDESDAKVFLSPNVIDRWPDTLKDLSEESAEPTVCEAPGRIYGHEMMVYERPKQRGSKDLLAARAPSFIRLQVGNMCFQILDELLVITKNPALREQWELDKMHIPENMEPKLARYTKADDWGPKETCSELFGSMIGGRDDDTDNLYRYFPKTKHYLITKLGLPNQ